MPAPTQSIPMLVKQLYKIVKEFEQLFSERRFTPDGHLVGSIGEVIAAHRYDLKLAPASTQGYDATNVKNLRIEIKITQGKSVSLRSDPEHLLVFFLTSEGEVTEVFNGPGTVVWDACGSLQKNGQRRITLTKLKALMQNVDTLDRLPLKQALTESLT